MNEHKQIISKLASAIAATTIYGPAALRKAAATIGAAGFSADDDEHEIVAAFAKLLEKRATEKEQALQKAFGSRFS